jgi:hypothetical protein
MENIDNAGAYAQLEINPTEDMAATEAGHLDININGSAIDPDSELYAALKQVVVAHGSGHHVTVTTAPKYQEIMLAVRQNHPLTRPDIMKALRAGKLTKHTNTRGRTLVDITEVKKLREQKRRNMAQCDLNALHKLWDFEQKLGIRN